MASGIDWFRWHHGSVTDPKFQLVAKRSGSTLSDVISVWAYVLEKASSAEFRGCFGEIDIESVDCLFGFEEGKTEAILRQMVERKLISDEYVVAWEKRQPKREDETSAERKRRQREREHELKMLSAVTASESLRVTQCHADVTQCHADVTQCHDREEERRGDISTTGVVDIKPAKRAEQISADFYPDETGIALAESLSIPLASELEKFRDYHKAHGKRMKDWQAAWRTWARNAAQFAKERGGNRAWPFITEKQRRDDATTRAIFGSIFPSTDEKVIEHEPATSRLLG